MRRSAVYLLVGVMAVALAVPVVLAATTSEPQCVVTITSPKDGDQEGTDVLVSGVAMVPPAGYLHIFARRRGLQIWWPQSGAAAEIQHSEYHVLALLGEPRDRGREFELVAEVVDANENAKLETWYRRAEETKSYPGIQLPPFLAGCGTPVKVVVTKNE